MKVFLFKLAAKLYLPKVNRSSGAVIDMWIKVPPSPPIVLFITLVLLITNCNINIK